MLLSWFNYDGKNGAPTHEKNQKELGQLLHTVLYGRVPLQDVTPVQDVTRTSNLVLG